MKNTKLRVASGIEVTRHQKESISSLLRRFNQTVRSSGLLAVSRKNQYKTKEPNRRARRESALVRAADRKRYQKMRKMGRIEKK
ncbi:MAG: hypothetical protein F4X82_02620 [Candidatus Spechtbacteria bacterium SB0662_bin_43]|uniref:30S ribosomal protein S21 n=1 Tax=Candidatus Spechtbacteria bacterium SB0662_bin_43 TaxID=2604897 RepID=A0A845DM24_9BACT|nr:hypothetical protein [Candidatus Spechtbacteria bacterium SB0662_bin_43]